MSCSDKMARWSCLGVQGALLSMILAAPLYLGRIIIAVPHAGAPSFEASFLEKSIKRAVAGEAYQSFRAQQIVVEMLPSDMQGGLAKQWVQLW
jgi:hypothetical protein